MSGFVDALSSYRKGTLSKDELLAEIDDLLERGVADSGALLAALNNEQARERLPGNVHIEIVRKLLRRRESPAADLATLRSAGPRPGPKVVALQLHDDEAATVLVDQATGHPQLNPPPRRKPFISVGMVLHSRFKLIEPIGEGGMSTVYKAIDLRKVEARASETHVAVKLLTVPLSDFTESLAVLQGEAHKLQTLPHPNIVRVIDCDRDGRTVFMTMEYLSGESLKRKLAVNEQKGLPAREALDIIKCVASGLAFAHGNGIVHGDLKPGNVLVTDKGEVKIIDFGIARLMTRHPRASGVNGDERPRLSALTPPYASPEMLENAEPDPRDDIYALACIAHELLTGRHPFDRMVANEARDAGMKVIRRSSMSAAQFRAIAHGLEFDREKRTPSAERFIEEFTAGTGIRRDHLAAVIGVSVLGLLALFYLLDRSRIERWLADHRAPGMVIPREGEVFRDCPTCPLMKALPPGHFLQGATESQAEATPLEKPRHPVNVAYSLGMGVYEITVGEFREFVEASGHKSAGCQMYDGTWQNRSELGWNNTGYTQTATHPVVCVSWRDAHEYAAWLSHKTGQRYRLPSDSEWEYAARAGSTASRPWSSKVEAACLSANVADQTAALQYPGWTIHPCSDGYVYSSPVGSFQPNDFGLYDMLGNAFEWVEDCWHADYRGAPSDGSAWVGGECGQRGMRGGSWFTSPSMVSISARNRFEDTYRSNSVGFRLVREIPK
jgi:formylglycine-generating enzyme required for sulfatase activity/predicted Ser/Thr protein kinase